MFVRTLLRVRAALAAQPLLFLFFGRLQPVPVPAVRVRGRRIFRVLAGVVCALSAFSTALAIDVGVSPTGNEPKQFSLDEDAIGAPSGVTPVDADDLSVLIPGIDGMGYVYQTFDSTLAPGPPAGYHSAVLNPFDFGLRRNVLQPGAPPQTHKDEVNAFSLGQDFFHLDGDLSFAPLPDAIPFVLRTDADFSGLSEPVAAFVTRTGIEFSVDVHAKGVVGSGVRGAVGPFPLKPSSHVFQSMASGVNTVLYGPNPVGALATLGIFDIDDVDAYENVPDQLPALGGPDELGMPAAMRTGFFSVDNETIGHNPMGAMGTGLPNAVNTQAGLGEAAGDIFVGIGGGGGNFLLIDEGQLGLWPGGFGDDADDLDALAIFVDPAITQTRIEEALDDFYGANPTGLGITTPLLSADEAAVLFSVEEGSIGLWHTAVDFEHRIVQASGLTSEESGDLFFSHLSGQNWLAYEATDLGLLETDELNALDTVGIPEPSTLLLALVALAAAAFFGRRYC